MADMDGFYYILPLPKSSFNVGINTYHYQYVLHSTLAGLTQHSTTTSMFFIKHKTAVTWALLCKGNRCWETHHSLQGWESLMRQNERMNMGSESFRKGLEKSWNHWVWNRLTLWQNHSRHETSESTGHLLLLAGNWIGLFYNSVSIRHTHVNEYELTHVNTENCQPQIN